MSEDYDCNAGAIIDQMRELYKPQQFVVVDPETSDKITMLVVPSHEGMRTIAVQETLDSRKAHPRRAVGTVKVLTLDSFMRALERWERNGTSVYADHRGSDNNRGNPSLVAVLNDHDAVAAGGSPGWCDHRIIYNPELSDEWKAWVAHDGQPMDQEEFAILLEDNILDVLAPSSMPPGTAEVVRELGVRCAASAELQALSHGLSVRVSQTVVDVRNLDSGQDQLVFKEEHADENGAPLSVPNAFIIAIPVFYGGVAYPLVVRLRYRVRQGKIKWIYQLVRPLDAKRDALDAMLLELRQKFEGVPVFEGTPPATKG